MEHYHDPGPGKTRPLRQRRERIDTFDFSQESEIDEVDPREEKIESLVEIICEAGDRPATALLVLMATLENSSHPKVLQHRDSLCLYALQRSQPVRFS